MIKMLQPLKLNVINKNGETILLMLDINNLEPYLFTMDGEPVEMIIRNDTLCFKIEEEEFSTNNIYGLTAEEQYDKYTQIIKLRLEAIAKTLKYLEKEKAMELLKNETLKEYKNNVSA